MSFQVVKNEESFKNSKEKNSNKTKPQIRNLGFNFNDNKLFQYKYNFELTDEQNRQNSGIYYSNLIQAQRYFNLCNTSKDFYNITNEFAQIDGVLVPNSFLDGSSEIERARIRTILYKLYLNNFQLKNVNVDKYNKRVIVYTDSGNEKLYVSFSNVIMSGKNLIYRYPISVKIFESFSKKFNMIKFKMKVKEYDTNEHFDYHSLRGTTEWLANYDNFDRFQGKIRITFGENISRSQYMPGIHFLSADSAYDKFRIEKYIANSYLPDDMIIRERLNHDTLLNYVNNRPHDQFLIQSTDALYYNPFLTKNLSGFNHRHIINVFNIKEGVYKIDDKVKYTIYYKEVVVEGYNFVEPRPENKSVAIIPDFDGRNEFINGKKYSIPYVRMEVLGNPETEPYEHPFPMFDGVFLSIQNINSNRVLFNNIYVTIYNKVIVDDNLYYCDFIFVYNNSSNGKFNIINNIYISNLIMANEDIIELNEKKFYDALADKNIFDMNKNYACRGVNNLIIIKGQNYILQDNVCSFDNVFSLFGGKMSLSTKDVYFKLHPKFLNHCLCHFRGTELSDKMITSCINSLIRLADTEEDLPQIDYFQARTIAITCSQIATSLNIINLKACEKINKNNKEIIDEIDKDMKLTEKCEKGLKWLGIFKQVNESLAEIARSFANREKHWFRNIFTKYDNVIDKGLNQIIQNQPLVDATINDVENVIKSKNFKLRDVVKAFLHNENNKVNSKLDDIFKNKINIYILLLLLISVFSLIFDNIILDTAYLLIFMFYFCVSNITIKNLFLELYYFLFTPRYKSFWKNLIFNWMEGIFYSFVFVIIYFIFDVCSSLILHYLNIEFAMEYLIVVFNIASFVLLLLNCIFRFKYSFINLCTLILYILSTYLRTFSVTYEVGYVNYIINGILFIYDVFKYNKVTNATIFLSLNKYLFKSSSVQSKMVYEPGTCSLNNLDEIIRFLKMLYYSNQNDIKFDNASTEIKQKYNEHTYKKFKIKKLPKCMKCNHDISKEHQYLINHNFQVNGHNVMENHPLKLHKCIRNEAESVYRQIQSGIYYDEKIMSEFISFSKSIIDDMVINYYNEHPDDHITLEEYYKKIGARRKEYEDGYEEYQNGGKLKMIYKMHNKDDEKQYLNFNDFKSKSRNICAQLPIGKVILALPCELGMKVIHAQPWCGPGNNYSARCKKFKEWIRKIGYKCAALCCDGSSFDSTQHKILIDNIDTYFINKIIDFNPLLNEIFDYGAMYKYSSQSKFRIYSKSGFLYDIEGTQLSGRMNTCLCNTLRSALYIQFILYKIGILNKEEIVNFEVNGDDQLIFINSDFIDIYVNAAKRYVYSDKESNVCHGLGQICKIFDVYRDITGAEYLSCYIIYSKETGDIWMVRKPERFFQLIPFTFRVQHRNMQKLKLARTLIGKEIIQGALIELKGIKLYEVLLRKYLTLNLKQFFNFKIHKSFKVRIQKQIDKIRQESYFKNRGDQDFNEEFNQLFEKFLFERFGVNDEDLTEYYDEISKVKDVDGEIHVSIIDKFYPNIRSPLDFYEKCKHLYENKTYSFSYCKNNKIKDEDFILN